MISVPIWLFVLLAIFGFIGLVHIVLYIFVVVGGVIAYLQNNKIPDDANCPYFVEVDHDKE